MSYLNGLRVVRGLSWDWGDQDGGEGRVGTVHITDDSISNDPRLIFVDWDSGKRAQYRAGFKGLSDLRVVDISTYGLGIIKHPGIPCGGDDCVVKEIVGFRWQCITCNVNLCTNCFCKATPHHPSHNKFKRYVNSDITDPPIVSCWSDEGPQSRLELFGIGYYHPSAFPNLDVTVWNDQRNSSSAVNSLRDNQITNKFSHNQTVRMRHDEKTIREMETELCKPCKHFQEKRLDGEIGRVSGIDPGDPDKLFIQFFNSDIYKWLDKDCSLPSKWMEPFNTDQPVVIAELAEIDLKLAARFFDSVSKGDLFIAQLLHTRYGIELNTRNAAGQIALHIACLKGFKDIVKWLLNQVHKGLEKADNLGFCAIHHAVVRSSPKILEMLIKAGAKLDCRTKTGETAIDIAVANQYKDCARLLIQHGCDVNVQDSHGNSPLHRAIVNNGSSTEIIEILISSGCIEWQLMNGENMDIFELAVSMNAFQVFEYLWKVGKNILFEWTEGNTILHYACFYRNYHMVKWMLDRVILLDDTTIHQEGSHPALKKLLETKGQSGFTALLVACHKKDLSIIELLVEAGAEMNAFDDDGDTAILQVALSDVLDKDCIPSEQDSPFILEFYQSLHDEATKKLLEEYPILLLIGYLLYHGCCWETQNKSGKKAAGILLEHDRCSKDGIKVLNQLASNWKRRPVGAKGCIGQNGECGQQAILRLSCPHRFAVTTCNQCIIPIVQQHTCGCSSGSVVPIPTHGDPSTDESDFSTKSNSGKRKRIS